MSKTNNRFSNFKSQILTSISFELKSTYQTLKILAEINFYKIFCKSVNQHDLVRSKLLRRNFSWDKNQKTKVFIILSINNWEKQLVDGLAVLGNTYLFTWDKTSNFFKNKEEWMNFHSILNARLKYEFDNFYNTTDNFIIFYYASDFSISADSVNYLNKKNTISISFCWDDILYFHSVVKSQPVGVYKLSQVVDFNYTLSPETIPRYNFNRAACYFWNSIPIENKNYNQLLSKIHDTTFTESFYVLFVGTKYGWREKFINQIKEYGINVICYGKGWDNGEIDQLELENKVFNAPLTLGFSSVGYTKNITTIKGRDFEIPFFGGLYITQFSKGLKEYYEIDNEILAYTSVKDCIDQIIFIKNNPVLAKRIRIAGFIKAIKFCGWESRILFLKSQLNTLIN
ncbi:MAG: glycosyltransferase family 1 protein [Chitinophagaceae bacterium]|nr:glycosyltransferase family 1 protein [Chitinophagaceae bacterium]MCA6511706.1 glycosyltransferase family 1 protein [Chitinophagaceae bacterium]